VILSDEFTGDEEKQKKKSTSQKEREEEKQSPSLHEPTLHLPSPTTHPTLLPLHLLRPCLSLTKPGKFLLPSYTPSRRFSDLAPGSRKGEERKERFKLTRCLPSFIHYCSFLPFPSLFFFFTAERSDEEILLSLMLSPRRES